MEEDIKIVLKAKDWASVLTSLEIELSDKKRTQNFLDSMGQKLNFYDSEYTRLKSLCEKISVQLNNAVNDYIAKKAAFYDNNRS